MSSDMERMNDILQRAGIVRRERLPDERPPAVCPNCLGAGYLRYDVPVDDPRFGELIVCECTRAELSQKRDQFIAAERKKQAAGPKTFDDAVTSSVRTEAESAGFAF